MSGMYPFAGGDSDSPSISIAAEFYLRGRKEPMFHTLSLTVQLSEEALDYGPSQHIEALMNNTTGFIQSILDSRSEIFLELTTVDNGRVVLLTDQIDAFALYPPTVEAVQQIIDNLGDSLA